MYHLLPPAPVQCGPAPRHRGEGVHNHLLRGLTQVVAVHGLEHPPGALDLLPNRRFETYTLHDVLFCFTFDLDQGTMKVSFMSLPGLSGLLPITRNLDLLSF